MLPLRPSLHRLHLPSTQPCLHHWSSAIPSLCTVHQKRTTQQKKTTTQPVQFHQSENEQPNLHKTHNDTFSCNMKIASLARNHEIRQARRVFDAMVKRDVVSWTTMMAAYIKNNDLPKAQKLFDEMPERNVVAWTAMLDGYAKVGRLGEAKRIFETMPHKNIFTWTSMIGGCTRAGLMDEARRLFNMMPMHNPFSWTIMLTGYVRWGRLEEARLLFHEMPERNVVAWTVMLSGYTREGRIEEARHLFDVMPQKNVYSWNVMISGYLHVGCVDEAWKLYCEAPSKNEVTHTAMLVGLAENGMLCEARRVFDAMPKRDVAAWNAMLMAYSTNVEEACRVFESMTQRNLVSWNTMIDVYGKHGHGFEAMGLLDRMRRESNVEPDHCTLTSMLLTCSGVVHVMHIHALAVHLGFDSDIGFCNALITNYSRYGDFGSARHAFEMLRVRDLVSWTAMVLACAEHGLGCSALQVFANILKHGETPDGVTFVGVLTACSRAGLIEHGWSCFQAMERVYNVIPRPEHYACMVDMLGRLGNLEEGERLIEEMPFEPDEVVYGALLGACRVHGDVERASRVGAKLLEVDPGSSGAYVLLANAYAAEGRWGEVAGVRRLMRDKIVKKQGAYSEIEVRNRVHTFFVGDRVHPLAREIYGMLEEGLLPMMKEMGYMTKMSMR
ncbi:pentatricopeptide repeat-containing protein At4g02750 [Amborella trichopoda]|uniref:Pentacotripeptide-repeat region of PRORP domain-containing protein n=1 Tax=Amborella trichopoda TaxID=13333 RepID=W1NL50_AMBTC|nr:pentatricopeptide repeat-containing protein At4g02750 [Amborella trichopoda]ERM96238.1 hypothetical protein AMTR_s00001p00138570 [Amborella trichopoda]|eukprot:XP_006828822.1 pentatricopeptide repeat-containing protein At4g02750 [Amborella trichopoda]